MKRKPRRRANKTLTFDDSLVGPIRNGRKTATVRYDDEKDIEPGDILKCKTPDGRPFARVEVTHAGVVSVVNALELVNTFHARHGADDWMQLRETLNEYYDDNIHPTTMVKVIAFDVIHDG